MILGLHDSPLGRLTLVSDGGGLAGVYFENHRVGGPPKDAKSGSDAVLDATRRQLDSYFAGRGQSFDVKLAAHGTAFQNRVWAALMRIKYGETATYGAVAESIGSPKAVRAAGTAIGRNPVSILIPCHRIIGADGALTGYAGGIERKRHLLALERGELEVNAA